MKLAIPIINDVPNYEDTVQMADLYRSCEVPVNITPFPYVQVTRDCFIRPFVLLELWTRYFGIMDELEPLAEGDSFQTAPF